MHSIVLDLVMSGLLVAVIIYTIQLNKKIDTLNAFRDEITPMLGNLTTIMNQASANVSRLKAMSTEINSSLSDSLPKATGLKDDLSFLIDHGERIAQRIEKIVSNATHPREMPENFSNKIEEPSPISLHADDALVTREKPRRWGLLTALKEVR